MKVTLATGGEINITEADRRLPCELCCVVGYSGGLYLLTDEKHESGHHVRGNRHKVKLSGVRHWIGAHKINMVGRIE